ncbi:MAG TPA: hypothetical protein VKS21_13520, partial [Spirochaetota bacterium]|nr:hypothetical protein [Spirochaetota bacterium]
AYYKYGKKLLPQKFILKNIKQKVAFFAAGADKLQPGDMLIDRDWYIIIKLIRTGGDLDTALQQTGGLQKASVFIPVRKMKLDRFVIFMENILNKRMKQVQEHIKSGKVQQKHSSLFLLNITLGDFYFYLDSDFKKALAYYQKGLAYDPGHVLVKTGALINAAESLVNLDQLEKSLSAYQQALHTLKQAGSRYRDEIRAVQSSLRAVKKQLRKKAKKKEQPREEKKLLRRKIVKTAASYIGRRWRSGSRYKGKNFFYDCSGTVSRIYWTHNIDLMAAAGKPEYSGKNGVYIIYDSFKNKVHKKKYPLPGDLIYFNNTYDKNRDGRWNDRLVHIGMVEKVDRDGTITYIHHCSKGVRRYRMNLIRPAVYKDPATGKVYNSFLRRKSRRDPPGSSYVSGNFFAGFATIIGEPPP